MLTIMKQYFLAYIAQNLQIRLKLLKLTKY